MLHNKALVAKIGFYTAENEPSNAWCKGLVFYLYLAWSLYLQTRYSDDEDPAANDAMMFVKQRLTGNQGLIS